MDNRMSPDYIPELREERAGLPPRRSKFAAFILSLVPGLGQWYVGLEIRGLYFILSFFGMIGVSVLLEAPILALVLGPLWLYGIADAMWLVDQANSGIWPEDTPPVLFTWTTQIKGKSYIAWGLLIVGILSLIGNLPFHLISPRLEGWIRSNMLGATLVVMGLLIIIKRNQTESAEDIVDDVKIDTNVDMNGDPEDTGN